MYLGGLRCFIMNYNLESYANGLYDSCKLGFEKLDGAFQPLFVFCEPFLISPRHSSAVVVTL